MTSEIIVGLLALVGTLVGTYFSNRKAAALMEYRLKELEDKVNKHNSLIERMYKAEGKIEEVENDIKDIKSSLK